MGAIGLQYLFVRAIGKFPSPILFGAIVDSTCLLWSRGSIEGDDNNNNNNNNNNNGKGSCLVYDSDALRIRFWGSALFLKGLIISIFIVVTYILWGRQRRGNSQRK